MKTPFYKIIFFLVIAGFFGACSKLDLETSAPFCIKNKIRSIQSKSVQNPPAEVWKWETGGDTYYYITSGCCDQYNYLCNEKCNQICAPDGGFTGNGDGNCPELIDTIIKTLVWRDPR